MCGVDMTGNKAKRTEQLCAVEPLEDDLAFELVNGKETWHPRWKDKIDDEINAQFIKAVINRIQQNEEVSVISLDNVAGTHLNTRHSDVEVPTTAREKLATLILQCQR
jgi:hypothetical protein